LFDDGTARAWQNAAPLTGAGHSRLDQDSAAGRRFLFKIDETYKGEANAGAKAVVCDLSLCHSYYRQRPFASPSCI